MPKTVALSTVVRVLQGLLREQVPIRDLRSILETLAGNASRSQDPDALVAAVRVRLGRFIVQSIKGLDGELPVITLDPKLDQILQQSFQPSASGGGGGLEPGLAERLHASLAEAVQKQDVRGEPAVLLVADLLRPALARMTREPLPALKVLAYSELPDDCRLRVVANVGGDAGKRGAA